MSPPPFSCRRHSWEKARLAITSRNPDRCGSLRISRRTAWNIWSRVSGRGAGEGAVPAGAAPAPAGETAPGRRAAPGGGPAATPGAAGRGGWAAAWAVVRATRAASAGRFAAGVPAPGSEGPPLALRARFGIGGEGARSPAGSLVPDSTARGYLASFSGTCAIFRY